MQEQDERDERMDRIDPRIADLFAAYREALPDPEPGPAFMPVLWHRIEARQSFALSLGRFARAIITGAAVASLLMAGWLARPETQSSPFYTHTYLELLAADQAHDSSGLADAEIVQAGYEGTR